MRIESVPFGSTNWRDLEPQEYPGEFGTSFWRTREIGNVRTRMVEYSAGYVADHWCGRGHVFLMLEGEAVVELKDGRSCTLEAGMSFVVADQDGEHRIRTEKGATAFIVD